MKRRSWPTFLVIALLATMAGFPPAVATFPGSNGRLAVVQLIPNTGTAVRTMEPDGSQRDRPYSIEGFRDTILDLDWSPDAARLALNVCCGRPLTHTVVSIAADGGDPIGVSRKGQAPAWSPDGARIAFDRFKRDDRGRFRSHIFLVDADGTHVRRFTGERGPRAFSPAWSPDGSMIAFSRPDQAQLAIKPVAGGPPTAFDLPDGHEYADHLEWSPDGSMLSFIGHTCSGECGDVWTLEVGTGAFTPLTRTNMAEETDADWSPDGTTIVFVRFTDRGFEESDLWFMDVDGANKRVLETRRLEFAVDWGVEPSG